jgi:hypothetical protein
MYTAESKDLKEELFEIVSLLEEHLQNTGEEMTPYELFKIALGMQNNRLYMEANVLGTGHPSALERISMVLENK